MVNGPESLSPSDPRIVLTGLGGQYATSLNVRDRFKLDEYSIDGLPPLRNRIIDKLGLNGQETIVDIGCSNDLNTLISLRDEHGHQGQLIGVDIDEPMLKRKDIEYRLTDARRTGLPDDYADLVMFLYSLYHMPVEEALEEAVRIVKPITGQLVAATSNANNKVKHRWIERTTARILDVEEPPIFADACDDKKLASVLPLYFEDVRLLDRTESVMRIGPDQVQDYLNSLYTMSTSCNPPVTTFLWKKTIDKVALPIILHEIETNGYFVDSIRRYCYIASNPRKPA